MGSRAAQSKKKAWRRGIVALALSFVWAAACDLNPQPIPPGDANGDSSVPSLPGNGGGVFGPNDAGSSDAAESGDADGASDASLFSGDGGYSGGDGGADASDAGEAEDGGEGDAK